MSDNRQLHNDELPVEMSDPDTNIYQTIPFTIRKPNQQTDDQHRCSSEQFEYSVSIYEDMGKVVKTYTSGCERPAHLWDSMACSMLGVLLKCAASYESRICRAWRVTCHANLRQFNRKRYNRNNNLDWRVIVRRDFHLIYSDPILPTWLVG